MRHLILFIKNPVLGRVKTRLAATLGDARALEVYQKLLSITRHAALGADCQRQLYYSDAIETDDDWDNTHFAKHTQQGDDLGERMHRAFIASFAEGATKAVIIGSDCPDISSQVIDDAFRALQTHDMVIGPALDGGYYLLGMKAVHADFFVNKQWSTATVLLDTISDAKRLGLSVGQMSTLSDLDNEADLMKWTLIL